MTTDFTGQAGLITGAASGLGLAISLRLSSLGMKLALIDKDEIALERMQSQLNAEYSLHSCDISNEAQVKAVVEKAGNRFGRIDVLINSAGITGKTNIQSHEVSSEDLSLVFAVNFMGAFYSSKYVLPWMLKGHYGRILHIASIAGKEGNAGMLAYSSSKAALIGMTKVQGKEYAESGITVNALAPAVIRTPFINNMPEAQLKYMTDKIPMKRCGTLDEVVNLSTYIVSPQNSFTTGFVFDLSGGRATY